MIDAEHTAVTPLSGISPEQVRDARARAWAFVFRCWLEKQMVTEPDVRNDVSITNRKEVNDVDQRLNRLSEIVVTHSRKGSKAWSIFEACLGRNIGRAPTA
jgi:hypothetical protein